MATVHIPAWAILVGAFALIAMWAAWTTSRALGSMASVSTAPSLEAAAGRAAIRGTIFILGVGLVAIAILAGLYAYRRQPSVPLLQDATIILTTPVPGPCELSGATPSGTCNFTPTPTSPIPTATPPATPATATPASQCGLAKEQSVSVAVPELIVIGSEPKCPDKARQPIPIPRGTTVVISLGPEQREDGIYWHYDGGECSAGWGPEIVDGQCVVVTPTPTPAPGKPPAATPPPIARQAPAR
ncbi:MAG: hypothetical protein U0768_06510 [Anaerolineae bacterium]